MIKKYFAVPAAPEGLDLTTVLRILLGLPRGADSLAIVGAVRALVFADGDPRNDDNELATLMRRSSSPGRKTRRTNLDREASLERAYLSQGLLVEKDRDGRITRVFRRELKTKGVRS